MSGVASLVSSGPLLLAIPVAAAAGAVSFLSPCVLPLVPGYLSYITGMSGTAVMPSRSPEGEEASGREDPGRPLTESMSAAGRSPRPARVSGQAGPASVAEPAPGMTVVPGAGEAGGGPGAGRSRPAPRAGSPVRPSRWRAVSGTALFVLGFSALYATYGLAFGGIGQVLLAHQRGLSQVLGVLLIVLGLMFAGAFERFSFAGRIIKPQVKPRAGLASAPLLGVLFGLGWSPCIGPTLGAVLMLGFTTGTAARGAFLAFVYGLGIGIPFLIVAFAVERGVSLFGWARRRARLIARIGGVLLIAVGLLELTGAWSSAMVWLQTHWINGYQPPI